MGAKAPQPAPRGPKPDPSPPPPPARGRAALKIDVDDDTEAIADRMTEEIRAGKAIVVPPGIIVYRLTDDGWERTAPEDKDTA
jgi:hypothetical protein